MAKAVTQRYDQLRVRVEKDPIGAPGVYTSLCGITDYTINRTSNIDTTEVPDCDDESLPLSLEREVRSQEVTVSGTGTWSQTNAGFMIAWWRSGATRNVRVENTNAAPGDISVEYGPALLASYTNGRTRGQRVSAEIEIQFDGVPEVEVA